MDGEELGGRGICDVLRCWGAPLLDCFPHKILLIFDSEHSEESTGRPSVKSILCQPN